MPYSCLTAVLPPFHGFSSLNLMNLGRFSAATGSLVAFFVALLIIQRALKASLKLCWGLHGTL